MKFDDNLELMERIIKRRRSKGIRFFILVMIVLLVSGTIVGAMSMNNLYMDKPGSPLKSASIYVYDRSSMQNGDIKPNTKEDTKDDIKENTKDNIKGSKENTRENTKGNIIENTNEGKKDSANESVKDKESITIEHLKNELESYIKGFEGQYGIYYYNLATGEKFGINHENEYIAASTIKIPINLFLYKKIKDGSVNPQDTIKEIESDFEEGTGSIRYCERGKTYTIKELTKLSIVVSDNIATNMLLRFLGRKNVKNFMRESGGKVVYDNKNISCPEDMALYMRLVYEFGETDQVLGKELLGHFKNAMPKDRIPALLPEDTIVAHKTGNQVRALHDVGIVYAEKPYILAVMTKDIIDEAEACGVIANISKKVYDFIVSNRRS